MVLDDRLRAMASSLDRIERCALEAAVCTPEIPQDVLLLNAAYKEANLLCATVGAETAEAFNGMNTFLQALLWRASGKPCFEISKNLGYLLSGTDVPSLDVSWVKLPFKSCCLLFQDCPMKMLLNDGKLHIIRAIMVCEIQGLKTDRVLRIEAIQGGQGTLGHSTFLWIPLDPGKTLRETLDNVRKELEQKLGTEKIGYSPSWLRLFPSREVAVQTLMEEQQELLSLVVNTLLYLTNAEEQPEIEISPAERLRRKLKSVTSPGKRKKLERQLGKTSDVTVRKYGGNIVIDRRVEEETEHISKARREGRQYISRWMVRGHWRNQAWGVGMADRKLLFVQPYWKGPRSGEDLVRNYLVK